MDSELESLRTIEPFQDGQGKHVLGQRKQVVNLVKQRNFAAVYGTDDKSVGA
jgi:hypothetical protein